MTIVNARIPTKRIPESRVLCGAIEAMDAISQNAFEEIIAIAGTAALAFKKLKIDLQLPDSEEQKKCSWEIIQELARKDMVDYYHARGAATKVIGMPVGKLDQIVQKERDIVTICRLKGAQQPLEFCVVKGGAA